MHLSITEMCMLSAAVGWIACGVCAWIFGWFKTDVHDMNTGELAKLLKEIREAVIARGGLKATPPPSDPDDLA